MTLGAWLLRHKKKLVLLVVLVAAAPTAHGVVLLTTKIEPPPVTIAPEKPSVVEGIRRLGNAYVRTRGGVREVYLEGNAETLGTQHARLLGDRMATNEQELWDGFARAVPLSPVRTLIMD